MLIWVRKNIFQMILFFMLGIIFIPYPSYAGLLDSACSEGTCNACDFVKFMISVATWALGLVGTISLVMFIYGGTLWIISGGNPERVTKGKTVLRNAVIGIVLALLSYLIIDVIIAAAGGKTSGGQLFGSAWNVCK